MSFDTNNGKGWTKEEIDQSTEGLADAFLLFSIIQEEDGGQSIMILPRDDENEEQELSGKDLFNCWTALAVKIIDFPDVNFFQKELVQDALGKVREFMQYMKEIKDANNDK